MLAHTAGGGATPVPAWLLAYLGAAIVLGAVMALRTTWPRPRLRRQDDGVVAPASGPHVGHLVGVVLFGGAVYAAIVGPNSNAANIAPVAVLVWWIGVPMLCLVLGDVVRAINPFVGIVRLVERWRGVESRVHGPTWVPAAFLLSFSWYFLAYYRPGSPRALALFLTVYAAAALACGLVWGSGWLAVGEGFGGLSASVARIAIPRPRCSLPDGAAALMVVWIGSTVFDGLSATDRWVELLGSSRGWTRTLLNTVGLVWVVAIVGALALVVHRVAARGRARGGADAPAPGPVVRLVGLALVPIGVGWLVAHDLTLLLAEGGQNLYALVSDPLGRGWDLFGTLNHTIDYSMVDAGWVTWTRMLALLAGHLAAVVLIHDGALRLLARRDADRTTWAMGGVAAASIVAGSLLALT